MPTHDRVTGDLDDAIPTDLSERVLVVRSGGRGPAAARNAGWRATASPWVVFVDDDVEVSNAWRSELARDLACVAEEVAGTQGRIEVPMPVGRRPTDWERSTAGLASAKWITADMAYRRSVLADVAGFDERFVRAFREDADLALRVLAAGYRLTAGTRRTTHPVRPADWWISVRQQAGNADDVLMARLHGPHWRQRAGAPNGRRHRHALVTAAGVLAAALYAARRRRVGAAMAALWLAGTAEFAVARIQPGPRSGEELVRMVVTSVAIPPMATLAVLRGLWRHRTVRPWPDAPRAVFFDRDGTLVHDVPYNGDPDMVRPVAGAGHALRRLRASGVRVGVVTNQSGIARGLLTSDQVDQVNARINALLGPFDVWAICPHGPVDGCGCRKPAGGLLESAAASLAVPLERCALVGDIGSDVAAARAAGVRGVLVPTAATRPSEIADACLVAEDLQEAVALLLGEAP